MSSEKMKKDRLGGEEAPPVIRLIRVGKVYRVYSRQIDRVVTALFPSVRMRCQEFHALTDISLEVDRGETIGIIGRNGSGKSTLLQVICRILRPSRGDVQVQGRISAMLELGAGFNPEFTGRENVYLNGAILGLSRDEIAACFADIEDFAGIGEFIDRPVKTYSSGMYVRLAFAVAINVQPDILIVDEALSVGDTLFQAKCFAKFRQFQEQGVTILFVTHSMDLITKYCSRAFLLEGGKLVRSGKAKEIVDLYNRMLVEESSGGNEKHQGKGHGMAGKLLAHQKASEHSFTFNPDENRYGNGKAEIVQAGIFDKEGKAHQTLHHGVLYDIVLEVRANTDLENPILAFTIKDVQGFDLCGTNTFFHNIKTGLLHSGQIIRATFRQRILLNAGSYLLSFGCAAFEQGEYVVHDRRYDLMSFEVISDRQSVGFFDFDSTVFVDREE